jgi:hypothetical protein
MATTGKGPLNYTTTIEATKSASECIAKLAQHGASAIGITYALTKPTGLSFSIGTPYGPRAFALPVNVRGTHKALCEGYKKGAVPNRYTTLDQAERVAWRVLKDWLEAQLALIEAGVADMTQVMLPYMQGDDGLTVWQRYLEREDALALEAGSG